ncbi:hypothetical protein QM012_003677 [Aureobasidium pullulans]|uniref:Uncharacterized protein n=1 Tax=Aureobasidium pullulans TaxID=5580 RepID=A0ABR0T8X2_AURPU
MIDKFTGKLALQIGCTVDQTLGERRQQHIDAVTSIIKDDKDCTQALSLTYAFWTSGNATAKFITLVSVPMPIAMDSDTRKLVRPLIRVIETFFGVWLNTWNGSHSSIPGLRTISISLWSEIYPDIDTEELDYVGLTSHTPLQETTTEFARTTLKQNLKQISLEFASTTISSGSKTKYPDDLAERIEAQTKRIARR